MAANEEKEAPALPKAGAKARALKAKKQCRKASTAMHKKGAPRPPSDGPAHCGSEGSPGILGRAPPGEASLTMTAMPPSSPPRPDCPVSLDEDRGQQCDCVHRRGHGQRAPDQTAVKKPRGTDVARGDTLPGLVERRHVCNSTGSRQ